MKITEWTGESGDRFITNNSDLLKTLEYADQVKNSDLSILIQGETGTGKDLLAKAIHYSSNRGAKNFVNINCTSFPETLFESELFGHKKGAYTGAFEDKKGQIEEAEGGTLFLNEIADIPSTIQTKLLRAVEDREVTRIGEVKPKKINFRLIAATNRDLETQMNQREFRNDLYYRLGTVKLILPPLRERTMDIPFLIVFFTEKYSNLNGDHHQISIEDNVLLLIMAYLWPGNIRELENDIKGMSALTIGKGAINVEFLNKHFDKFTAHLMDKKSHDNKISLYDIMATFERNLILSALQTSGWNQSESARLLLISEGTIRNKMKRLGIQKP